MIKGLSKFIIIIFLATYILSCMELPETGREGGKCFKDNTCLDGLICRDDGICIKEKVADDIIDVFLVDILPTDLISSDEKYEDALMDVYSDISTDIYGNECVDNCSERCRPDKICENGYCVPFNLCKDDYYCPCGWHCNKLEYKCYECERDEDCNNRTDGKTKCDIGKTYLCIEPIPCNNSCNPNCQICEKDKCVLAAGKCCQNSDCPSNNCVNYVCEQLHTCGDVCSTDQECKTWCNDQSYICNNNVCIPQMCQKDSDCDSQCGAGLGQCLGGTCQCKQ